jgi:ABC-type sugar transport system ATPase subunit
MAKLVLQHIGKVFSGGVSALDDVTLEVADGETCVVVGPSGSGKTTLLRLVAGLEEPTSGRIFIGDRCVNEVPPHRRDVAMVFQNYPLYPHMTVRQNLGFSLKMLRVPRPEIADRVAQIAGWLRIAELLDRGPEALSGGQRQRVALGKALIRRPAVLLLDEPLSSVDAQLRDLLRREFRALLREAEMTCLYVTHDQAEAMALADRLCVIASASIQQTGTSQDVYGRPANRFVAGFFGNPSMNFGEAIVERGPAGACLSLLGDHPLAPAGPPQPDWPSGGRVVVGVRPHDLRIGTAGAGEVQGLRGVVTFVEPLGARTDVGMVDRVGQHWIASVGGDVRTAVGDTVTMTADPARVHLFETGPSGRRLGIV